MGVDGADAFGTQQLHRPTDGGVVRYGFQRLEDQGVVSDDQFRAPPGRFPADILKGIEGDQNFRHRAVSAAAQQAHVVPVHFHSAGGQRLHIR